ncbi:energy transducer TonB [Massilia rubra]|uniref:TonB family protein n=1 Tax=Massilia rubra TaxID=2607910 RepID=A0ABX0LAS1_9BURK|nr:TonB family protein [Massilia rubra]
MKHLQNISSLSIAVAVSVAVHAALLAVRFVAPEAFNLTPTDPGLEVILVNAKHANKPLKADALAQANLDGGGNAEDGRAASPLPDMRKDETGESVKSTLRRITELEQMQKNLLTKANDSSLHASPVTDKEAPDPERDGNDLIESTKPLSRQKAEIAQRIEDQNKRPRKTFFTPSTQEVGYAVYYKSTQKKIEDVGTLNFPQKDGKKLYGELIVYIPIFQDGTIYTKEGGVRIEKSSGNPALDKAALAIVRRAAPFSHFPKNMRSNDRDDLWIMITSFKFTREDKLEAELRGQSK